MKKLYRVGFKGIFPFGLFPNAAIWKLNLTEGEAKRLEETVATLRGLFVLGGKADIATRLILEEV
jgi:hypothetical protein